MINRILERLEELKEQAVNKWDFGISHDTYSQVIEIVKEEFLNGGWIPCSERLPEEDGYYLVTMKLWTGSYVITHAFSGGEWHLAPEDCPVLAWQPLPEPWKGDAE